MLRPVVLRGMGIVPEMQVERPPVEGAMMGFWRMVVLRGRDVVDVRKGLMREDMGRRVEEFMVAGR